MDHIIKDIEVKGAKITVQNGRRFALVARAGSYSIIWQALPEEGRVPDDSRPPERRWHPINSAGAIGSPLAADEPAEGLCCMVRDPVERFRSACARQGVSVEEGLTRLESDVHFWSLAHMGLLAQGVTHFRFPAQLDACAEWLGLATPVPQLNDEPDENKPALTTEQEAAVRAAYAADIALWESLQEPAAE
jgi:hypothetical protein